jgi:hypothetical protein
VRFLRCDTNSGRRPDAARAGTTPHAPDDEGEHVHRAMSPNGSVPRSGRPVSDCKRPKAVRAYGAEEGGPLTFTIAQDGGVSHVWSLGVNLGVKPVERPLQRRL